MITAQCHVTVAVNLWHHSSLQSYIRYFLVKLIKPNLKHKEYLLHFRDCITKFIQRYLIKCPRGMKEAQTQSPRSDKAAQWPREVDDCTEISPILMFNLCDFPGYEILPIS